MEQKYGKRYKPLKQPRLRDYFDSVIFGGFFRRFPERIAFFKKVFQSSDNFFRFLREMEKLAWCKLMYPPGHYYVQETEPGTFKIIRCVFLSKEKNINK